MEIMNERFHLKPANPIAFKFLYAKENNKLELHLELEWVPRKLLILFRQA